MSEQKENKPKVNSFGQKELDKAQAQFDKFDAEVKSMTHDRMNAVPKADTEGHQIAQKEIEKKNDIYLKPKRTLFAVDKNTGKSPSFNERFREEYNFQKEYVNFVFENKEITGETTTIWTRPFPGLPAEEWEVPTNKPIWGPRYLAEQIKRKFYHRLKMDESVTTSSDGRGQFYGAMAVDSTVQRLDAHPVSGRKSIFMGASGF
jgi:hypothetical protein